MYALAHRINFEQWRLGLTVISATGIFIGMSLALPLLALHPVAPFIGAALIIAIWIVSFTLTRVIEQHRPNDRVEKPQNLSKLGFFAQKNMQYPATSLVRENIEEVEPLSNDVLCF